MAAGDGRLSRTEPDNAAAHNCPQGARPLRTRAGSIQPQPGTTHNRPATAKTSEGNVDPVAAAGCVVLLLLIAAMGAAGWFFRDRLTPYGDRLRGLVASVKLFATSDALAIADRKSLEAPPFGGFSASPEATDAKLQETALWRVIKREFPDWYAQRLNEGVTLARAGTDEAAISQQIAKQAGGAAPAASGKCAVGHATQAQPGRHGLLRQPGKAQGAGHRRVFRIHLARRSPPHGRRHAAGLRSTPRICRRS